MSAKGAAPKKAASKGAKGKGKGKGKGDAEDGEDADSSGAEDAGDGEGGGKGKKKGGAKKGKDKQLHFVQASFKGFKLASNVEQQDYAEVQKEQSAQLSVKCRLGYAFMDLIHPPDVQLYFGRYNNRPLDQVRVKELAKGFREQGIAPWQDPIPI
ncbi:hypothetical protein GY45DRAFT_1372536 [Cubamyces sp. BRFM 1775]|nr:hypothetical protein GY45DRAFT_1372536 [Cubamyces sp. BRFM 1775]